MIKSSCERFLLEGQYHKLLSSHGINVAETLRKAGIAEDIFNHKNPFMTVEQYFHFMEVLGDSISNPETPIKIGTSERIEYFSPPIFAAYCSKDVRTCIERIGKYKRLIGPLEYVIKDAYNSASVEISARGGGAMPQFLSELEIIFIVHIIRSATKEPIRPLRVVMQTPLNEPSFKNFIGCSVEPSEKNAIILSKHDLALPFITRDDAMWSYFEPELRRRLYDLSADNSISARLRIALTELLPGGFSSIDDAAKKLGLSRRTLQRKLNEEGTTFQQQLHHIREILAKHYIRNTDLTNGSIAYLLGYQELNSFLRAFFAWTGITVGEYRRRV